VTLACATRAEAKAGRKAGFRVALVGLRAANGLPEEPVISFGLAGALDGLATGAVVDAVRVVDEQGRTLWEGDGLGVAGAVRGTILATDRIVDDPAERVRLHRETGADAADLESGPLARAGLLRGVLRAIGDTPERPLHGIEASVRADGNYAWGAMARAFVRRPRAFVRAARDASRALHALREAARV
jgi:hypothetical protein